MKNFEDRLKGGHPNSLGNTIEIVEEVLADYKLFDELFNCYFSEDETVRLRTSNAVKRICKAQKMIVVPYIDLFLNKISSINQASTKWTLAQLFNSLEKEMSPIQIKKAKKILKNNLINSNDWIVLSQTIETLTKWSSTDLKLQSWLKPELERLTLDKRKSVSNKALKSIEKLKL